MDVEVVTEVVDAVFTALEVQFAGNTFLLLILNTLEALANSLIPSIVGTLNAARALKK